MLTFGEVFAGISGFGLGLTQAGMECRWQIENDKDCNRVLERHYPSAARYGDVKSVKPKQLEPVDVIAFGWPCTDLSVAGLRAGLSAERSGLFFEAVRILAELRPRWFVAENVPGLFSSYTPIDAPPDGVEIGTEWEVEEDSDFENVLCTLTELGYCVSWRVCDAQFWGVAQRRERVFLVGSLGNLSAGEVFPFAESMPGDFETRREAGAGVTPILEAGARTNGDGNRDGDGIGVEGDPMFTLQRGKQHAVAATLDQRGRGPTDAVMMNLQVARALTSERGQRNNGTEQNFVAMPLKAKANSSHDESHETYVTHALRSEGADASEDGTGRGTPLVVAEAVDVRNLRMQPDGTSGTLQHKKSGGYSLNYQNPICFSSKDHGADAGEIAPTLRAQNFDKSHINGGGQVAVAWALHSQNSCAMTGNGDARAAEETDRARALDGGAGFTAGQGGNLVSQEVGPALAFTERTRAEGRTLESQDELAYAVTNPGSGGRTHSRQIAGGFGVRRLTPTECERLQSFPDGWTSLDAEGKTISDSARYRMLGNAVCVNVARWIGKRIMIVNND